MNKTVKVIVALMVVLGFAVLPALADDKPVITLEKVEIASIAPFYVKPRIGYKSEQEPGKEETYGYSSMMSVAYVLNIKNPGKKPIMLDELQFTVAFEEFDINTPMVYEKSWIPAGKTNQVRVVVTNEAFPTIVSLSVGAEFATKIAEMKTSPGALVSKWWKEISDFSFPIAVKNGTARFTDEKGKSSQVSFAAAWPMK
jgi:hypothetical protein